MVRNVKEDASPGFRQDRVLVKSPPDLIYFVLVLILVSLGTVMLFSAGSGYNQEDPTEFLWEHLFHLGIGAAFTVLIVWAVTPKIAKWGGLALYILAGILLVLVLFIGKSEGEAKRWLFIGPISVQPSEIAKTALIIVLATYFSVDPERFRFRKGNIWRSIWLGALIPALITGALCALVLAEKHLSGMGIILIIGVFMMFLGGTSHLWIGCMGVGGGGIAYLYVKLVPYAQKRIEGLMNRGSDPDNDWQTKEGLYAMGNGGLFGRGIGNSVLKYGYVSQPQNDFIFAVICEELGFFGAIAIILLFLALTGRGFRLAAHTTDRFTALTIAGLSFKIILHVFLNIGVATALLPNTGISLPFFSSGGSATIIQIFDVSVILGLSRFCND